MKTCRKLGAGGKAGVRVAARANRRRQRHPVGSGLSGGRCSGLPRRRRGAWSARGFWLPLEGLATARRVVATKGARSGKRFVRCGLTRRALNSGSVSRAWPRKKTGDRDMRQTSPFPRRGNATRVKPPETEVEATPNTAGRHSPTVLVTRDRSGPKGITSTPSWTAAITPQRRLDKGDAQQGRDGHPTACRRRAGIRRFTGYSLKTQPAAEDGKKHLSHREADLRISRREE